jgi:hypothetical protein
VGINYVMPEDGATSMADYALHMKIVGFLHGLYPKVHISLHAGFVAGDRAINVAGIVDHDRSCEVNIAIDVQRAAQLQLPGSGDAGTRVGTGGGATAVECLPFRSACFFPFTLASPLRELIPCRFVAHLITAWHE